MGINDSLNINIHSPFISKAFEKHTPDVPDEEKKESTHDDDSTPNVPPSNKQQGDKNTVKLDLAGHVNIHISSPSETAGQYYEGDTQYGEPLFRFESSKSYFPSFILGLKYDFNRCLFGVTRIIPSMFWKVYRKNSADVLHINLSSECSTVETGDYSLELAMEQDQEMNMNNPFSKTKKFMTARLDSSFPSKGTISLQAPLMPRINLLGIFTFLASQNQNFDSSSSIYESAKEELKQSMPKIDTENPEPWLPTFSANPNGKFRSTSEWGWNPKCTKLTNHMGIKFSVKKQLDSSALFGFSLGGSSDDEEMGGGDSDLYDTFINLGISGLESNGKAINSLAVHAGCRDFDIWDVFDSAHLTFSRKQIVF